MTQPTHGGAGRGQGRKPLATTDPTIKVAITLLSSQVEAMEKLGNGNLSAGIRKAIDMTETINTTFDPSDLPAWAQKDADVVERSKSNLAFRCDVYDAQTAQRRRQLTVETRRLMEQLRNR